MKLKKFFIRYLSSIILLFPLIIILFYGISTSTILTYKHRAYEKLELQRYEEELKTKHQEFFKEKVKYIDSFINFLLLDKSINNVFNLKKEIILFVESLKKYDRGFIFIFQKDGTVLEHPCANRLIELVKSDLETTNDTYNILNKLLYSARYNQFIIYKGTDCVRNRLVNKIAFVHHIKNSDIYIVISKNQKDISQSIEEKKQILEDKLNDDLSYLLKLLIVMSFISIVISLIFSRFLTILIKDYDKEIKNSHDIMFQQSRLAQAGELLSMIAHQWRQPISKIASITSNLRFKMMLGEDIDNSKLDKKLEAIEEHTEFLSETIDDFKEFYKPKKDKELLYILPLIEKSISFLENEIKKKKINIIKEFDKDIKISLYRNELMQVVINIIQNAIDFSKKNSFIEIKTILKEKEYIITIKDEAGGIKPENIEKIFDAHFSTKNSRKSTNLGLGLYVSKVIIDKHFGGKLEVESINESSKFTIRLVL